MKYALGIDIGSNLSKAVVLRGSDFAVVCSLPSGGQLCGRRAQSFECSHRKSGNFHNEISTTIATGYGASAVDFADSAVADISCHGAGVFYLFPGVRTVVDLGNQFCRPSNWTSTAE